MKEDCLYSAEIRFYQELNDFLPKHRREKMSIYRFLGKPTVKDVIESLGVPHTEVDLILLNGVSVAFNAHLRDGDRVAVYPRFESLDITPLIRLRPEPLREVRFITDVHLGKLARYLRMLGFDTLYDATFEDEEIIRRGIEENRIILTRDLGILKNNQVTHGYFLRHTDPKKQIREVVFRFDLKGKIAPFSRCLECNHPLKPVAKEAILERLSPDTGRYFETFFECPSCQKVFWEGSHHEKMTKLIKFIFS